MPQPESIETMLSRLMPVAFSEEGQRSMDAMLDELCGGEPEAPPEAVTTISAGGVKKNLWKFAIPPAGIAAATALAFFHPDQTPEAAPSAIAPSAAVDPGVVVLGESERIEMLKDEGWLADPHGAVMQAARARVVGEDTMRDEETGIVFCVSERREELILNPITSF